MMKRVIDENVVRGMLDRYPPAAKTFEKISLTDWLANPDNVVLQDGDDFALFESAGLMRYWGHYFFSPSTRGRAGVMLGNKMLDEMFGKYRAEAIQGLTPVEHRGALWMNKQLGFQPLGVVETGAGPHQLFLLLRTEREDTR